MAATKSKPKTAAKRARKAAPSKSKSVSKAKKGAAPSKKGAAKVKATEPAKAAKAKAPKDALDFGEFPAGSVTRHEVTLCLSCIFKLFTNQLGLAPRTAYNEIRR